MGSTICPMEMVGNFSYRCFKWWELLMSNNLTGHMDEIDFKGRKDCYCYLA